MTYDVAIIGGGIVGAATFYKLQKKNPNLKIVLIEKMNKLADHQTGQYGVAHDVCGKVVVATDPAELPHMDKIFQTGLENKIEGIEKISAEQVKDIEPYVESIGGIWVPVTGIIDFRGATEKMAELALAMNPESEMHLGEEVLSIEKGDLMSTVVTTKNRFEAKYLVFCAGLQADRLAKKDGLKLEEKVVGFRGEIECGPNAVFTFKREGYGKTDFSCKDTVDALTYSGTWKLFFNNMSFGINEYRRAFSKKLFLKTLQRMIPSLTMEDIHPGRSGVRALLLAKDGDTRDDFRIEYHGRSIHVLNAPSPAATASLAIGGYIAEEAEKHFGLK